MKLLFKLFNLLGLKNFSSGSADHPDIPANELNEAIERVVDGIEPKMRYFPGYKKILRNSVATSLAYISHLVDTIPGPLIISRKTFTTDPQINAYFATVSDIQTIFSNSAELRDFFDSAENSKQDEAYALLCMEETEKTVLGMELNEDIIQRDVMQTALIFSDHKILSPATSEDDVRKGIKLCIFDGLITHALQQIIELKHKINDLDIQRSKLHSRLKTRQSQGGGLSSLLASATEPKLSGSKLTDTQSSGDIEQRISENEKTRQTLPTSWDAPRHFLEIIKNILEQPENFVRLQEKFFNITKMGIVCNDNSSQTVNTIHFNEILIANVLERVVAIVRFPRSDLLPKQPFNLK